MLFSLVTSKHQRQTEMRKFIGVVTRTIKVINKSQFLKFFILNQLPIYAFILWVFILLGLDYWIAYLFANQVFIIVMFPIIKHKIFDIK